MLKGDVCDLYLHFEEELPRGRIQNQYKALIDESLHTTDSTELLKRRKSSQMKS